MSSTSVVIPNWNGVDLLDDCLKSLRTQTQAASIIVVDNNSSDNSVELIEQRYPEVTLIKNSKNLGFAGGVNTGIKRVIELGDKYVALLNSDAVADKNWLKELVKFMEANPKVGITTSKICDAQKTHLDSTGDQYTIWGLPFPRGRGEAFSDKYDKDTWIFAGSGGASIYRTKMLKEIGLFDEDFFLYYEDVDLSFRAQLAGWKVAYAPKSLCFHKIGASSEKVKGLATYHTLKNLPLLFWKNVPKGLRFKVWIRLLVIWSTIAASAAARGQIGPLLKACLVGSILGPKKLLERRGIQNSRKVSIEYINSIIIHDLPPNAHKLRRLRNIWWKITFKRAAP